MSLETLYERRTQLLNFHERNPSQHLITASKTRFDPTSSRMEYVCRNSLGERWLLGVSVDQLVYPTEKQYDQKLFEKILEDRGVPISYNEVSQADQDHALNFVSANWSRINTFLYSSGPEEQRNTKFQPSAYTEVALHISGKEEHADLITVGWDGTVFVCEFSASKPNVRKNGQARRYRSRLKERTKEAGLDIDSIPFYVRCGFDEHSNTYTLKWNRVPKNP